MFIGFDSYKGMLIRVFYFSFIVAYFTSFHVLLTKILLENPFVKSTK